jgi:hypothetical protein
MIVYVTHAYYQPDEWIIGVFSTDEKAQAACEQHEKDTYFKYGYSVMSYEIDEEVN